MDCNTIEWLVDILGTTDLLSYVISTPKKTYPAEDISKDVEKKATFNSTKPFPDGLYFIQGHWYSCKNNIRQNSYDLGYQIKGTAHFCQTFAVIIFNGLNAKHLDRNRPYAYNIEQAVSFWINLFDNDVKIRDFFIQEIKTSKYAVRGDVFEETKDLLKNATWLQVRDFLVKVQYRSQSFTGCIQG